MNASMKDVFYPPTRALSALFLCLSLTLTACNEYPTANIPDTPLQTPLEIIIEPKKVAMTNTWAAGVKEDGTLWTWGSGQGNLASELGVDPTPLPVAGINDAVAISAGTLHMLLLRKDGSVWGWGVNNDGQIDPNSKDYFVIEPRRIEGLVDIVDISADDSNSIFVTKKGEVYVLGGKTLGWANGIKEPLKEPTKLANMTNIIRVESMVGGVIALNDKGEIYTMGIGSLGRMVEPLPKDAIPYYPAQKVELPRKVVDMSVSTSACMVLLDNGEVWVWGDNSGGRLALPKGEHPELPIKHPILKRIVNIGDRSAVDVDGNLYMWGAIGYGNPKAPSQAIYRKPIKIAENIYNPAMIVNGSRASAILDKQGNLYTWGWNEYGQLGAGKALSGNASSNDVKKVHKSLFTTH